MVDSHIATPFGTIGRPPSESSLMCAASSRFSCRRLQSEHCGRIHREDTTAEDRFVKSAPNRCQRVLTTSSEIHRVLERSGPELISHERVECRSDGASCLSEAVRAATPARTS